MVASVLNRLLDMWLQLQVDPVPHIKFPFLSMLISLMLHLILCSQQMLLDSLCHCRPFIEPFLQWCDWGCISRDYAKVSQWMPIQHFKWCGPQGWVICGIVPVLCQWEPLWPFSQAGLYQTPLVCFQVLVKPLCLSISLRVVRGAHVKCCFCKIE
jgi:hypothetical protein